MTGYDHFDMCNEIVARWCETQAAVIRETAVSPHEHDRAKGFECIAKWLRAVQPRALQEVPASTSHKVEYEHGDIPEDFQHTYIWVDGMVCCRLFTGCLSDVKGILSRLGYELVERKE